MPEEQNPKEYGLGRMFVVGAIGLAFVGVSGLIYMLNQERDAPQFERNVCIADKDSGYSPSIAIPELKKDCDETYFNETAICELNNPNRYEFHGCVHNRSEEWRACLKRQK